MSNLPPGVHVSDIPGNRPEDLAYEALWDRIYEKAAELKINKQLEQSNLCDLIDWVYNLGWEKGFDEGRAEEALNTYFEEMENETN